MTPLLQLQLDFAALLPRLLDQVGVAGLRYKLGECLRSDEQAVINALKEEGRAQLVTYLEADPRWHGLALAVSNNGKGNGILMSIHRLNLAVDLMLFTPAGDYLTDTESYRPLGEWWEGQNTAARWGGRFRDSCHFSFEFNGVR
jgi:hypothetical protein